MLLELHNSIQQLIYQHGQIDPHEVDISFEVPTRELIDKLLRPTISLFLFDLQENTELRQGDFTTTRINGRAEHRMMPRRFDLRYMVSVLTTAVADEHQLLWRVLLTLLRHQQFPDEVLSDELRTVEPALCTRVSQTDEGQRLSAIWTALGVPPHPALSYIVTVPVDLNLVIEAPLVLTRTARYTRKQSSEVEAEIRSQIGGVVRNSAGIPLAGVHVTIEGSASERSITSHEGRFTLRNVPTGTIKLRVVPEDGSEKIVEVKVPEMRQVRSGEAPHDEGPYDIVLEAAAI